MTAPRTFPPEVLTSYANGRSKRSLARYYGTHTSTLRRWLIAHGATIRASHANPTA